MITLVLGGARSGKSRYAESFVQQLVQSQQASNQPNFQCVYIATAQGLDAEMRQRIAHHQTARAEQTITWQTVEQPRNLAEAIEQHSSDDTVILVECLSLWLSNELLAELEPSHVIEQEFNEETLWQEPPCDMVPVWQPARSRLMQAIESHRGHLILVSNEVGQGVVPLGEINRRYVDEAGWLHQDIAAQADRVVLVTAGIPQILK
ncbi:bifunctional adenosylcobinamide kinase/adenosylcobinamide-phosphate guanylyltransferase [Shewanella gelidii]|uniref:Bifunctional adenosylcobalamin biosynthesis protein n=1 Tax=Shewanella gelidii TaxID=1642821 RepID=A0A917JMS2_9GAMM|nr:bifunctional adenosylcobinamide kinase/adenosylcobinamide-phosphate guanylyltransferase [Shewanella gelidii]MCL1097909.1 bifunctional adenosylcobinamide kinase/adenosylcobinamide-phosphate guanylyltransferase [Shewanella gelidii]GGI77796.1 bifunctional adenosylcobinamide kinase/adenosylcobinamide-phosphate guanylyltransferase [Shewanella gelidii]